MMQRTEIVPGRAGRWLTHRVINGNERAVTRSFCCRYPIRHMRSARKRLNQSTADKAAGLEDGGSTFDCGAVRSANRSYKAIRIDEERRQQRISEAVYHTRDV